MTTGFNLGDKLLFQNSTATQEYAGAGSLINTLLPNIYLAAGLIIFFMIIMGGFMIISSASDPHKTEDGKKIITSAIMGLAIVICSYWIIQLIQVVTGLSILN
jgi:hypothetical protein